MEKENKIKKQLLEEIKELRIRLKEAEETLSAIRSGGVDAIVVSGLQGEQVFTLTGAERAYRVLIETMNEGAASLNQEGTIIYCNQRFSEMIKTPLEKVIGTTLRQFIRASDLPVFDSLIEKGSQEKGKGEVAFINNDGTVMPVLLSISALQKDNANIYGITVTDLTAQKHIEEELRRLRDNLEELVKDRTNELETSNQQLQEEITERKKAQQKIEEARTYAESIIETMREPLIVLDTDLKVISANRSFYKTFKVNPKGTKGQFIYDLGNRQWDIPKLRELLEDILPNKSTFDNYEIEHTFKTIGLKTMLLNARRLENAQMILLTIDDITERKRIEDELVHANEENFRSIFDNAGDGILLAEIGAKKFYMGNNSICRMLGYSPEEIVNLGVMDIHPEKDLPYVTDQFERQAKGEFALSSDLPIKRKDGSIFYADVNATTIAIAGKIHLMGFFHDTTERKQQEDALERLHHQNELILNSAGEGILGVDIEGNHTFVNPSAARMLGYEIEELIGQKSHSIWHHSRADGSPYPQEECKIYAAYRDGAVHTEHDEVFWRKDGTSFPSRYTSTPILEDGKLVGAVVSFRNITERKQAEKDLQESMLQISRGKQEWESTIDSIPQLIFLIDNQGCILRMNRMVEQWNLGQVVHLEGKSLHELMHPGCADLACFLRNFWSRAWEELSYNRSSECEVNDRIMGRYLYIQVRPIFPIKFIETASYAVVIVSDVTERKQAEVALMESEEKFRTIFDNAGDGILLVDMENKKFYIGNNAICHRLGYSPEEIKNLELMDIHPEKDLPDIIDLLERQAKEEFCLFKDLPIKTKDGSLFYADVNATTINIAGKTYQIAFFRDVTEQKIAEEERRRVSELRTATEIKSKFTSMVSHELRSPLGVIKEGINLVLEGLAGNINDEQKDLLDTAKRNTDRLSRLINDVLDFDKIESGKMEFEIRENDINEAALEVRKAMSLLAEEKGLDLVVDVNDSIPKIRFDKDKILQVFTNLLSNAIKFTEKGSISISMKQEDNMVHVIVQDTGVGIEAKDMQKLFQPFEQLDNIRDKKKGGTGLGLAISKEIILAHKGKIWAESEAGRGATFHFTLPLEERRG